jgi:hypothetical protein
MRMLAVCLSVFLMACGGGGDDDNSAGTGGGGSSGSGGGTGGSAAGGTGGITGDQFTVTIGPIHVESGEERTQCVVKNLGNPNDINVGRLDNHISSSSHHLIVYRSNEPEAEEAFDCDPFTDTLDPTKGAPIMITQKHDDFLQLPPGIAYQLPANQNIRLELHYINTTQAAVDVEAKSTFTVLPDGTVEQSADLLFIGTPDISLPPKTATSIGPLFFKMPTDLENPNFFAITGHTHSMGTNVTVESVADAADTGAAVYDVPEWLWSEPETVMHDPVFNVPTNGGFRFQCDYNNTSSNTITFGESATKEMCFFWAYYYPSKGAKVCFHTKKLGADMNVCCPGSSTLCSLLGGGGF